MKTSKAVLVALSLLCTKAGAKKSSKAGAMKSGKSGKKSKRSKYCPADAQEAAVIGNMAWLELWHEILEVGDCNEHGIAKALSKYLTEDMRIDSADFTNPSGDPVNQCDGKEACIAFLIGGNQFICLQKSILSFTGHNAVINTDDCANFRVAMNEYVQVPEGGAGFPVPSGRTYSFRMSGKKKKSKKEPFARISGIYFECPYSLDTSFVTCGPSGFQDPGYVV